MPQSYTKQVAKTAPKKKNQRRRSARSPRPRKRKLPVGSTNGVGQRAALDNQDSQASQVRREFPGCKGVVGGVARFLARYMAMPDTSVVVISTWVIAAYLIDHWDRFPHLAITSPEKRCGKTTLLELLMLIVPRPRLTANISPAALYRLVQKEKPTLLMDESQSLSRRGSEASEVIREILNAGISRESKVTRCGGNRYDEIEEFSVYSPKVFALIGELDPVLSDRSLTVPLRRKTSADKVDRYRSRVVEVEGETVRAKVEQWIAMNAKHVATLYNKLQPFDIENDRMADLLMPLQAVLSANGDKRSTDLLRQYAEQLEERDRQQETQSPGVLLLTACREIFGDKTDFIKTSSLIPKLTCRAEEPWHRWNKGSPINAEGLAILLRPYGIKPSRNKDQSARGYHATDFEDAWQRYLPSKNLSNPAKPATTKGKR